MKKAASAYAEAGVDIDAKMQALRRARRGIEKTFTADALGGIGAFGGLFRSPGRSHLLVASTDGVGTKLKVAHLAGRHDTVGQDLVNHCVNDILVQGAEPLFFLDYLGASRLDAGVIAQVLRGLCKACTANGCALIGGETAELPGLYPPGEYDLVGTIVGQAPRRALVDGTAIREKDVLIGLPSSGLHTNGYTLARKAVFDLAGLTVRDRLPGTRRRVGDLLLAVHRSYLAPVRALREAVTVRGMAHITGGGFPDNLARVMPGGLCAVLDRSAWTAPPLFHFIAEAASVEREEMYRVFNMGIGFVLFVRPRDVLTAMEALRVVGEHPVPIGNVQAGRAPVRMVN